MKILLLFLGLVLNISLAQAESFRVQHICIEGLKGLNRTTVLSYLPIRPGQVFDTTKSAILIRSLYKTGFFSDIQLGRQADSLLIKLVERPVIARVVINGNKQLPKDKLDEVAKDLGLVPGGFFDPSILDRLKKMLQFQYDSIGKYSAQVTTRVLPQPSHRVNIDIEISEGLTVQIASVHIIGHHAFGEHQLTAMLPIGTHSAFSFLTHSDEYNRTHLDAALEALRSYYLDRGYLHFKINSTQVSLTPDRKQAYIVIRVTEGPVYTVKGYRLMGHLLLDQPKQQTFIRIKPNTHFSRQAVKDTERAIKDALGDLGYASASVSTFTEINERHKVVFLTFYLDPGRRTYVRRINISGHLKTKDEVIRRLLRQQEGSLLSTTNIKESIRQLNLSGLLDRKTEPQLKVTLIPDQPDLVDLDLSLVEEHSFKALFNLGYGTTGVSASASLEQPNIFGTGSDLALILQHDKLLRSYSLSYANPYYTLDGVQRSFSLFYTKWISQGVRLTNYNLDTYGADMSYVIPVDVQGDALQLGTSLRKLVINLPPESSRAAEIQKFTKQYGNHFNQTLLSVGWGRNGWDHLLFPTQGLNQKANLQFILPIGGEPLGYYKASYKGLGYFPLGRGFILETALNLAYGAEFRSAKGFPFFENYYAGGVGYDGQVRGYALSTLGPRDSRDEPLGGNILTTGSVGMILPPPISSDSVRASIFLDGGNVYSSLGVSQPGHPKGGTAAGPLRYSAGVSVDWRLPLFGILLRLSLAKPINPQAGDQTEMFQFSLGTGF